MVSASATEWGPSQKAIAPASASSPISAISSPLSPLGQGGGGVDADLGVVARAAQDEVDHRGVVDRRIGVGARDKTRHATGGGGRAGAGKGLAMLSPRLADEGAHIDEARGNDVALAVDDPRLSRQLVPRDRGADAGDDAFHDNEPTASLGLLNGIDQTRVDEGDRRS